MKAVVKLNTFFFPWELDQAGADLVLDSNPQRYHEALDNLTPEAVFLDRPQAGLTQRERINQQTLPPWRAAHRHPIVHAF